MILFRYEVLLCLPGHGTEITHRRFMTHDAATYYLLRHQNPSQNLEARVYDRKKKRYLGGG